MKKNKISQFLLLLALFSAFALNGFSQNPEGNPNPNNGTAAITENDRLPFMQNEQAAPYQEQSTGGFLIKTLGAMLLIVGLIFFGAWGLKKAGFGSVKANDSGFAPELAVVSTISLGTNRSISAVRFGERILLVGSTAQSFTLLAEEGEKAVAANRSVADLLAEEEESFGQEFQAAEDQLDLWEEQGGARQ